MKITLEALYAKLQKDRVIVDAEQYAYWTLPSLMASSWDNKGGRKSVVRDFQEVGALLVNNVAAKLCGLLFPLSVPYFKIDPAMKAYAKMAHEGISKTQLDSELSRTEKEASARLLMNDSYANLLEALRLLVVTGNVLVVRDPDAERVLAYSLRNFVVKRDGRGRMVDCVLREWTYVEALPPDEQRALQRADKPKYSRPEQKVAIYTRIKLEWRGKRPVYVVSQEYDRGIVTGSPGTYPADECPYIVATWRLVQGEDYGRGLVEDYSTAFGRLSALSESSALYGIEMMRVVHLVQHGMADIDDVAQAETGAYVYGQTGAIVSQEQGDAQKLAAVVNELTRVTMTLSKAFMYEGTTRDAERVTAFELQRLAKEAEHSLGGALSAIAASLQVPLARVILAELAPELTPAFADKAFKINITAGVPALGRASAVQDLAMASQELQAIVPVLQQVDSRVDLSKVADVVYAGRSIDTELLFKSPDQMQAEQAAIQQQAQGQAQMMQAATAADQMAALNQLGG